MRGIGSKAQRVRIAAVVVLATALLGGVAAADDPPPTPVTVTGGTVVGDTLTATTATPAPGQNFHWERCDPSSALCESGIAGDGWTGIDGAGGVVDDGVSTYTLVSADVGHLIRATAKEVAEGSKWSASEAVGPVTAPPAPPPPEQLAGQGPIFDQTGNVEPTQGTVQIELPNGEVRQINQVTEIPVGSVVDVSNGHAILTTQRKPGGPLQSTEEWGAAFKFDQKTKGKITQLTITDSIGGGAERAVAARRGGGGGLWGRGRCRCRTRGSNSSGTARGTFYLVKNTNKGTFTKVKHGEVVVKDFRTGEKVVLKKGESYLARKSNG